MCGGRLSQLRSRDATILEQRQRNVGRVLTARIVRTNRASWRLGQALVPFAILATVAARPLGSVAVMVALLCQAAALFWFVRARRYLGRLGIETQGDGLVAGETLRIPRTEVQAWTLVGSLARLYGSTATWTVTVNATESASLASLLSRAFGQQLMLRRRGSQRARAIAAVVAGVGATAVALAFAFDLPALVVVGVAATVVAIATLGALSQRVSND